jgi:hypothetical protein
MKPTSDYAAELQADIHRSISPAQRFRIALDMSLLARELAAARRRSDPAWKNQKLRRLGRSDSRMATERDVFRRIASAFDRADIPHMLTGAFASSIHGIPRATPDIDFVIEADERRLSAFVRSLRADEYDVDVVAATQALRDGTQFNILDLHTGWNVDLIMRKARQFSIEEFDRREPLEIAGTTLHVATAEDTIITKLERARLGGSSRLLEDVASILRTNDALDMSYIERWVVPLGVVPEWAATKRLAGE